MKDETIPKDNTTNPKFYMQTDKLIQKHSYKQYNIKKNQKQIKETKHTLTQKNIQREKR